MLAVDVLFLCLPQFLLDLDDQFYAIVFEEETLKRKLCHNSAHLQPIANGHSNVSTIKVCNLNAHTDNNEANKMRKHGIELSFVYNHFKIKYLRLNIHSIHIHIATGETKSSY